MSNDYDDWPHTHISEILKIPYPIIQAPMAGGATTPALIAAVSNAGGLGSLAAGYLPADEMKREIQKVKALTYKPFAVNLFIPETHHATAEQIQKAQAVIRSCSTELNYEMPLIQAPYAPDFDEQMKVLIDENIPIFSFTFGIPSEKWIKVLKKNKITLIGTATTLEEAKMLEIAGIDIIVAQGCEAGGHRGTFHGRAEDIFTNITALLSSLMQQIAIPIVAAGGIMDARGIVKALKFGASAVQMGTAFLSCPESGIHPAYKKLLLEMTGDHTTLTRAFSGKLARGIKNKFIERMKQYDNEILDYPIQNALTNPMRHEAAKENNTDFMALWAGQSAYLCQAIPAMELIQELNENVTILLKTEHRQHQF